MIQNERVDRFLLRYFPELPEKWLRAVFAHRDVLLDGKRVDRDVRVFPGQEIWVYYPENQLISPLEIIYEDENVLLVNKRAGISVEPDSGGGLSLTDLCAAHALSEHPDAFSPQPCHRLDNKTSGLCLFAKNKNALETLQDVFRTRTLEKTYECLVRGLPKPPAAECRAYLVKDARRSRVQIYDHPVHGSRVIVTQYQTLSAGPISRLQVHPITGRTHQIRAHLSALGHPILGDDLYGDRGFNRLNKVRSLRLCAVSLCLDTGGRLPALDGVSFRIRAPF